MGASQISTCRTILQMMSYHLSLQMVPVQTRWELAIGLDQEEYIYIYILWNVCVLSDCGPCIRYRLKALILLPEKHCKWTCGQYWQGAPRKYWRGTRRF